MGLVYLLTLIIDHTNELSVGKYTSPINPMGRFTTIWLIWLNS